MRRIIHYAVFLFVVAAISTFILVKMNDATKGKIAYFKEQTVLAAQKAVMPKAANFDEKNSKKVVPATAIPGGQNPYIFIPAYSSSKTLIGYVVNVSSTGYSSDIAFVLGIDLKGNVTGLKVTYQNETPGLGDKIEHPDWEAKWLGASSKTDFNKSVDAFAGSTISPKAVYTGMVNALDTFNKEIKGAK